MSEKETLLVKHGGYRKLKSFQLAQLVFDITVRFCKQYVSKFSRTTDQMVQAARSGVQNIAEGSQAAGTSKKTELKLTNVARASLEELRLDYEDYLRQRNLPLWERNDPRRQELINRRCVTVEDVAQWVKEIFERGRCGSAEPSGLGGQSGQSGQSGQGGQGGQGGQKQPFTKSEPSTPSTLSTTSTQSTKNEPIRPPSYSEIAANAALILLAVACSLLDRQIAAQAKAFETEGGFTERLYRVRSANRRSPPS